MASSAPRSSTPSSSAAGQASDPATDARKGVVLRLVEEVMSQGRLEVLSELYTEEAAARARDWIAPFRASFPDVEMRIVSIVAEGEQVVARFVCAGTHLGEWRGHPPTGRRFRVDEVYWFTFEGTRIASAWGIEDSLRRLRQLGLE